MVTYMSRYSNVSKESDNQETNTMVFIGYLVHMNIGLESGKEIEKSII